MCVLSLLSVVFEMDIPKLVSSCHSARTNTMMGRYDTAKIYYTGCISQLRKIPLHGITDALRKNQFLHVSIRLALLDVSLYSSLSLRLCIYLRMFLSLYLYLSRYLFLSGYISIYIYLCLYLSICLDISFSLAIYIYR